MFYFCSKMAFASCRQSRIAPFGRRMSGYLLRQKNGDLQKRCGIVLNRTVDRMRDKPKLRDCTRDG